MPSYTLNELKGKKTLVLGGLGAIGSNLALALYRLGADVAIMDSYAEGTGANEANIREIKGMARLSLIKGDIRNMNDLKRSVVQKDVIFNCAAQVSHTLSMKEPLLDIDINCDGQINVLEACRQWNSSAVIVYTGTRSQFGNVKNNPVSLSELDNPADIYSADKLAGEIYHSVYHSAYGLKTVSLRLTNIYGPRAQMFNPSYNFVNWLIAKSLLDQDLTVYEPGTQLRDLCYVEDAVDALILAAQTPSAIGEIFLIGSGAGVSVLELAQRIVDIAKTGCVRKVPWPSERKAIEPGDIIIDYSKAKNTLGWEPITGLDAGLSRTIDFYRERKNDYFN